MARMAAKNIESYMREDVATEYKEQEAEIIVGRGDIPATETSAGASSVARSKKKKDVNDKSGEENSEGTSGEKDNDQDESEQKGEGGSS
jgi:hypothetical protein